MTLNEVEKGEPGVSRGTYATALFVLGLVERVASLADPKNDAAGLALEEELPLHGGDLRRLNVPSRWA